MSEWFFKDNIFGITYARMRTNKGKYEVDVQYQDNHIVTQSLDNMDVLILTRANDENKILELLW